ncbi:hypothetical protein GH714_023446 [Hevea brasiliensis]|uniref:Uncharacterized protein n=1 Tax=Hevea brasiliensis TaxID=3981 RepID=A0A6A6L7N0_HEVBR|nr:hypothetical protein GH714_023446 [Hevea brasiliensis]
MVADKLAVSSNMGMRLLAAAPRNVLELLHMDMQGSLGLRTQKLILGLARTLVLGLTQRSPQRQRVTPEDVVNEILMEFPDVGGDLKQDAKIKLKKEQEQFKVELKAMRDTAHWRRHKHLHQVKKEKAVLKLIHSTAKRSKSSAQKHQEEAASRSKKKSKKLEKGT